MTPRIFLSEGAESFKNYADALELAGAALAESAAACEGLLLPGGGDLAPHYYGQEDCGGNQIDEARDAREMALVQEFISAGKPILGICRGAQLLAAALGGTLHQHVNGHSTLPDGSDSIHETRTAGVLAGIYGPYCTVNSAHHQAIANMPPDCRILQLSTDGVIEAFCHNSLPIFAVQWHPERLCGRFARPDAADGIHIFRTFLALSQAVGR